MTSRKLGQLAAATVALVTTSFAAATTQAPIIWTVKDIKDKNDISTGGKLCVAANLGPEVCEKVVNGVHFQADRSHWTRKIVVRNGPVVRGVMYFPAFNSGGYVLTMPYNRTAPWGNSNAGTRHSTDPDYDFILKDVRHTPSPNHPTIAVTCSIDGLTPGNTYEIQLFYGNQNQPSRITEWDNGVGGREGKGGIFLRSTGSEFGQVATGAFVAAASGKQTFTNYQQPANNATKPPLKATFNACSAIQIRELNAKPNSARATYYGEGTPGTNTQPLLGGSKCSPAINLTGHPRISTKAKLTAENSRDKASAAAVVIGLLATNQSYLGGTLLVNPAAAVIVPVPMPQPASPYVHDHELQIPLSFGLVGTVYVQVPQLDPGAKGGVSFTPGLKIEVGT